MENYLAAAALTSILRVSKMGAHHLEEEVLEAAEEKD